MCVCAMLFSSVHLPVGTLAGASLLQCSGVAPVLQSACCFSLKPLVSGSSTIPLLVMVSVSLSCTQQLFYQDSFHYGQAILSSSCHHFLKASWNPDLFCPLICVFATPVPQLSLDKCYPLLSSCSLWDTAFSPRQNV